MSEAVITPEAPIVPAAEAPAVEAEKPAEALGEGGIKALQAEREARAALEKELKEFKDRDKSDAEKAAERLAAAEQRAADLETKATRAEVAATKSVPSSLLAGPASGSAEDLAKFADALIAFRGDKGSKPLHVRNEGSSPLSQPDENTEFVSNFFARGD